MKNVDIDDEGEYQCVASNDYNAAYSSKIVLRVEKMPEIIRMPTNYTVIRGQNAIFSCSAIGKILK